MVEPEKGEKPESSGSQDNVVNFDDPLYVHPSDNGVLSIISLKLTGTDNYRIWKSAMVRALRGRNKLGFVDGSFPVPNEDNARTLKWERVNAIVCGWILGSISETLYANHVCAEIASELWTELSETYHKADGSVIFNVHQKINALTQNGLSVSEYFSKLDALWKEFDGLTNITECTCAANASFTNHAKLMKLMQFLNGLDESFNQVKSHILLIEPLPSVRTAFSIISREESLQKGGSLSGTPSKTQASAFAGNFNGQKKFNNNFNNNFSSNTGNSDNRNRNSNLICKHC